MSYAAETHKAMKIRFAILAALACLAAYSQQQQQSPASRGPIKPDPSYEKIATESGGRVYAMDPKHPLPIADVLVLDMTGRVITAAHGQLQGRREFEAPMGDEGRQVMISVTGESTIEIRQPDGTALDTSSPEVRTFPFQNGPVYVIASPQAGTWRVTLSGQGSFSLKVSSVQAPAKRAAESASTGGAQSGTAAATVEAVEFSRFEFEEPGGRPGHEGLFRIQGQPLAGATYPVEAAISGDVSTVQFELRSPEGDTLQKLRLNKASGADSPGSDREYAGQIEVPATPFIVYATGLDMSGRRYQTPGTKVVRPQSFLVSAPRFVEWTVGQPAEVPVTIRNSGDAATFDVVISDTKRLTRAPLHFPVYVTSGEAKQFTIALDPPRDGKEVSTTLVITATHAGSPDFTNFATLEASFRPNQ